MGGLSFYNQVFAVKINVLTVYAPRMGIPASETLTFCRKATYPRTNGKIQS